MKRAIFVGKIVQKEPIGSKQNTKQPAAEERQSAGFALVLVLVAVALLALMMETLLLVSNRELEHASNADLHAQLTCAADSAVNEGILTLLDQNEEMQWPQDGSPRVVNFGGFLVTVSIQSEAGKVDLNKAPRQLIFGVFTAAGLDRDQADVMADRVMDWREPGDLKRLNGAKTEDYVAAGLSYRPRLGPFQTIDELRLVMGMTSEIYDRIKNGITVYSILPGPQLQTAPSIVLSAIGLNNAAIEEIISERSRGEVAPYGNLAGPNPVRLIPGLPMTIFTITADVTFGGQHLSRTETVRFTGDPQDPFWILKIR